jgi:hypothetical protein
MNNRKLIVVGTDDGDVGKTATAIFLAEMYRAAGKEFVVLDADNKNKSATGESSLAHALPHHTVIWMGTGPTLDELESNPDAANVHWDKLRTVLDNHDVIVDIGANTVRRLLEYAIRMRVARRWAEDGIAIEFWVPFLSDTVSIDAGLEALNLAARAFGKAALRAVRNHKKIGFGNLAGTPHGDALAALEKAGVIFVDLPKAQIPQEGQIAMDSGPWSAYQVRQLGIAGVAKMLGLTKGDQRGVVERTVFGSEDWIDGTEAAFGPLVTPKKE